MNELEVANATGQQILIYYIFVFLSFIYFMYKYRKQQFLLLVILLFFNGLFGFLGKDAQNGYRIVLVVLTIYWIIRTNPLNSMKGSWVLISFFFFTFTFLSTSFLNDDYILIILSQYSRYLILFSLFFILLKYLDNEGLRNSLDNVLFELLFLQIILSVLKFIIMGATESIVGSIGSQGGAIATSLPILGMIFIWYKKKGLFEREDWFFLLGLMFIGFVSNKRAVWFIMPIILFLLIFYVPKRKIPLKMIFFTLVAIPFVFYLGVRLNYTLNREHKVWGSFNLDYALNYAKTYSFGDEKNPEKIGGRGGATLLIFNDFINGNLKLNDWMGSGLRQVYATNYEEFSELDLGIKGKGAATGIFQTKVSNGYIGVIVTLWFALSMLFLTKNKRLLFVLSGFFLWEYFLYTGIVFREPALSFMFYYLVLATPDKISATAGSLQKKFI